jgi:glutamate synthase (NADPH/NADH) large chain
VQESAAVELEAAVRRHLEETDSAVAAGLLEDWPAALARFTEVMPSDFKRVLEAKAEALEEGLTEDEAATRMMEALHG